MRWRDDATAANLALYGIAFVRVKYPVPAIRMGSWSISTMVRN